MADTMLTSRDSEDEFTGTVHVYRPFRAGLPALRPYLRELWRRRAFALEASSAEMRASQANTVLGRLWNVLNPLLLAGVYYTLVYIIRGGGSTKPNFFAHLLAGLFLFYFVANAMSGGAKSVVSAGKMVTNTAFPRALLPLSAVRTALRRFVPTLLILLIALLAGPVKLDPVVVLALPWFIFPLLFAAGTAFLLATSQVYFRDTTSFLPYITRIWLYTSPVLWFPEQVPSNLRFIETLNPLYSILGGWSQIVIEHEVPPLSMWLAAAAWSISFFVVGFLVFVSRERDFAVRL